MKSVSCAGESAIGQESDGVAKARTDQSGSDGQHFTHPWSALGSFVTNHHDIAGFDRSVFDAVKRCFFVVKHSRGAAEIFGHHARRL